MKDKGDAMYINKNSPIPVYFQLKTIILQKIENGEFIPERPIPSERELGEILGISRMTVRQALNQLVAEGVLYREKGKGTFVSKSRIHQRNISSFSDIVRSKGMTPSTRVLNFTKTQVSDEIASILGLEPGEPAYDIKRLRLADDTPIAIEEVFIPEKYCHGLEKYDLTASLYNVMKNEYSYTIHFIDNTIEAVRAAKEERELLDIPATVPVLSISGVTYTTNELKLWYERSLYRSDLYVYSVRIYM